MPGSLTADAHRSASPVAESASRTTSIARLASSPLASYNVPSQSDAESNAPLAGPGAGGSSIGPGQSALAAALQESFGKSPPSFGTPPLRPLSPAVAGNNLQNSEQQSMFEPFDPRSIAPGRASPALTENPEIVKRHLVQPARAESSDGGLPSHRTSTSNLRNAKQNEQIGLGEDGFSSLQLQGGDVTREVYRWAEEADAQAQTGKRGKRSQSFVMSRPEPESDVLDIGSIKVPGGFRRDYLRRQVPDSLSDQREASAPRSVQRSPQSQFFTQNFIEFLTLYGHFAGEELEEDDEVLGPGEYFSSGEDDGDEQDGEDEDLDENDPLLTPSGRKVRKRKRKERGPIGTSSQFNAALLLLKSFVGTGVLFLPKAYLNGGLLFSNLVLIGLALINTYCFILLIDTQKKVRGSFGDLGGALYGKYMRAAILISIALSQIGFVAAYIVFTAENLHAFVLAVSKCRAWIDIKYLVMIQLIVFLPLSLIRKISKLGATALVADAFILLGLIYLSYFDIWTIVINHGFSDVANFNPRDWTLFVGTAIFTFEGIGLVIPIKEAMKQPSKFNGVLAGVMIVITAVFVLMGTLSYAAFGSKTKTVILSNLPQDNWFVNGVQLIYSTAIILSTPLQLFPAIRIAETELFTRSGKHQPAIKWKKNIFRFFLVVISALIAWGGAADLDKFVSLSGSFLCIPLVYIYPVSLSQVSV